MLRKQLAEETENTDESFLQWHVAPDYGELDDHVVYREADGEFYDMEGNGTKLSGWTNPLGWSDTGANDEQVLMQQDERGFVTPWDNGLGDESVVNF